MLKGVTKRIVEIKSPSSEYFERAVLYLRADKPYPKKQAAIELAEDYLSTLEPPKTILPQKNLKLTVVVLSLSLAVTLTALAVVLLLYTKM